MRKKMQLRPLGILLCALLFLTVAADDEIDGYSGSVQALFDDLTNYESQVTLAKEKMNEFDEETWDRKYAIALVHLYTQQGSFYLTLNTEMRNNYPATTNVWRRSADLLNRAIDLLGPKIQTQVFRGCQPLDELPVAGKVYHFTHIITASYTKETAVSYITCANEFLFQIKNAYGLSVERYSHFALEREMIMKSTLKFNVVAGPVKEGKYEIYFLDGQAETHVNDNSRNSAYSPANANMKYVAVMVGITFMLLQYF